MAKTEIDGDQVKDASIDLAVDTTGTLAIGRGGTGQTAKADAFDALSPMTSKGDLIVHDGADAIRIALGANGKRPQADSAQASGLIWVPASGPVVVGPVAWAGAVDLTTLTAYVSNSCYFYYLGRALGPITTCDVVCRVGTAAATITWAEVAIFKGDVLANAAASLSRLGFTSVSGTFNTTGIKKTAVALTGVQGGDDLWVVFGSQATTPYQLRAGLADDIQDGSFQSAALARPSTVATPFATTLGSATLAIPWCRVKLGGAGGSS